MSKKTKKIEEAEKILPDEVVLLHEACDVVMENAKTVVTILHDLALSIKCHGKRDK